MYCVYLYPLNFFSFVCSYIFFMCYVFPSILFFCLLLYFFLLFTSYFVCVFLFVCFFCLLFIHLFSCFPSSCLCFMYCFFLCFYMYFLLQLCTKCIYYIYLYSLIHSKMENLKQRHRDLAREKYADIVQAIMDGKVAVKVERVSKSGMTRKMSFYLPNFQRITREIAEMTEWSVDKNGWLIVGGCGMDMCFHALYCALPYELSTKRSQRYTTL